MGLIQKSNKGKGYRAVCRVCGMLYGHTYETVEACGTIAKRSYYTCPNCRRCGNVVSPDTAFSEYMKKTVKYHLKSKNPKLAAINARAYYIIRLGQKNFTFNFEQLAKIIGGIDDSDVIEMIKGNTLGKMSSRNIYPDKEAIEKYESVTFDTTPDEFHILRKEAFQALIRVGDKYDKEKVSKAIGIAVANYIIKTPNEFAHIHDLVEVARSVLSEFFGSSCECLDEAVVTELWKPIVKKMSDYPDLTYEELSHFIDYNYEHDLYKEFLKQQTDEE